MEPRTPAVPMPRLLAPVVDERDMEYRFLCSVDEII
jgi:hypothetical protein